MPSSSQVMIRPESCMTVCSFSFRRVSSAATLRSISFIVRRSARLASFLRLSSSRYVRSASTSRPMNVRAVAPTSMKPNEVCAQMIASHSSVAMRLRNVPRRALSKSSADIASTRMSGYRRLASAAHCSTR